MDVDAVRISDYKHKKVETTFETMLNKVNLNIDIHSFCTEKSSHEKLRVVYLQGRN